MGMKPPKGKAEKIAGTTSGPSDVNNYTRVGNATTVPKDISTGDPKGSEMPKQKPIGNSKTF